jgi:hypothetical protein
MMWIFAAAMALVLQAGEWVELPPVEGFVVGYQQTAGPQSIEERVPRGESVQDWSRMITTLKLGIDDQARLLDMLEGSWKGSCAGATVSPRRAAGKAGPQSLRGRMDCPRNTETGKPETFLYRTFAGRGVTHMVQIAFRHVPDAAEVTWAEGVLDAVELCSAASAHPQCRR